MTNQKPLTTLKNFRFYQSDIAALKKIVAAVNKIKQGQPSKETEVIRALLRIGATAKPETILKAIKDSI